MVTHGSHHDRDVATSPRSLAVWGTHPAPRERHLGQASDMAGTGRGTLGNVRTPGVFGAGYEGRTQGSLIAALLADDVQILIDVRFTPISRRPGLSKTKLGQALDDADIEYLHLKTLGNPKDNRDGFADLTGLAGRRSRTRFRKLLQAGAAPAALETVTDLAETHRVALLCFEADERTCHRAVVLDEIAQRLRARQNSGITAASVALG